MTQMMTCDLLLNKHGFIVETNKAVQHRAYMLQHIVFTKVILRRNNSGDMIEEPLLTTSRSLWHYV